MQFRRSCPEITALVLLVMMAQFYTASVNAQIPAQINRGLLAPSGLQTPAQHARPEAIKPPALDAPEEQKIEVPAEIKLVDIDFLPEQVKALQLVGASLMNQETVDSLLKPYQNQDITRADLDKLITSINQWYHNKGYLTTMAIVPNQALENGVLSIHVIEGRLSKLDIKGNQYTRTGTILKALDLETDQPLNISRLEDSLNAANADQDVYRLKAVLSPGEQPGQTQVAIETEERLPFQITPFFDNQGRSFAGTYRWGTQLNYTNPLGLGDDLSLTWLQARGTNVASADYTVPLNRYGTELGLGFFFTHVKIKNPADPRKLDGYGYVYSLNIDQPLTRDGSLTASFGNVFNRVVSDINHVEDSVSNSTILYSGLTFGHDDRFGSTSLNTQANFGANFLGGTTKFYYQTVNGTRVFNLPKNNFLVLKGLGVFSPDAIPASQQIGVGGAYSVRGFTEGLIGGDRGYVFNVDYLWPIPFLKHVSKSLSERLQGVLFFDIGQGWVDGSSPDFVKGESYQSKNTLLVSTGFGLRATLCQYLQGFIDVGFGLTDRKHLEPTAQPTARIHFGLRSSLVPVAYKRRGALK
jgi:hemolysin activation/secretion protein